MLSASFPFFVVPALVWLLARALRSEPSAPATAESEELRTPTGDRIERVRNLVEAGALEDAVNEGRAWLRDAEAGTALLGPQVALCLASVVEAHLPGLPATSDAATAFGEELLAELRSRPATEPPARLRTLLALAQVARSVDDPAKAGERYAEAVAVADDIPRFERSDLVFFLICLAAACRDSGRPEEGLSHLGRALRIQETLPGGGPPLLEILALTGWLRFAKGELTLAREALERAAEVGPATCSEEDWARSGAGECLGRVLLAQGDSAGAVERLAATAEVEGRVFGSDSAALVSTLFFLGSAHVQSGSVPDAVRALERAREIHARAVPGRSKSRREIVSALARLKLGQGEVEESRRLLAELLEVEERVEGPDDPRLVPILVGLAAASGRLHDAAEERALLERALAIAERAHGAGSAELIAILEPLGLLAWNEGEVSRARAISGRLAEIQREQLGPDHPDLARTRLNQAIATARAGEHRKAEELFGAALDVLSGTPFPPEGVLARVVSILEEFQGRALHGGGYRGVLERARALKRAADLAAPIAQA